jgi:hypothetical protein
LNPDPFKPSKRTPDQFEILFLIGFALLFLATYQSKLPLSDNSDLLELGALFFRLLIVPIVIMLANQVTVGNFTAGWLLPLEEIAWVITAIWVVKD